MTDFSFTIENDSNSEDSGNEMELEQITSINHSLLYLEDEGNIYDGGITYLMEYFMTYYDNNTFENIMEILELINIPYIYRQRIYYSLRHYTSIYIWTTKYYRSSYINSYNSRNSLQDPLNNFTTKVGTFNMQRGIWRWLYITNDGKYELVLAVPPRHWAFGKKISDISNFVKNCIATMSIHEFNQKYEKYLYLRPVITFDWWFIVIRPFDSTYITNIDIINAINEPNNLHIIKNKEIMSIKRIRDSIIMYCNILNNLHKQNIGSEFLERSRRRNKRSRNRHKRKILSIARELQI